MGKWSQEVETSSYKIIKFSDAMYSMATTVNDIVVYT